jgi:predicted nuclease of predicted toxin-antitoxin system
MKILLDAQLPRSLARPLRDQGFDTLHTFDLPDGNRSSDAMISASADRDGRVVFSKDADFIQSHFLRESPLKLLVIATGNISNKELFALFQRVLPELKVLFQTHRLIELSLTVLIIRR